MVEVELLDTICRVNNIELSLYFYQRLYIVPERLEAEILHLTDSKKSLSYKIQLLESIQADIMYVQYTLRRIALHIAYVQRKNQLTVHSIFCVYETQQSIIFILRITIECIMHTYHLLYFSENITTAIHKAYEIVCKAEKHKHSLSHLSATKDTHQLKDILLYLNYVHRLINTIKKTLFDPIERHVKYPSPEHGTKRPIVNEPLMSFDEFVRESVKK